MQFSVFSPHQSTWIMTKHISRRNSVNRDKTPQFAASILPLWRHSPHHTHDICDIFEILHLCHVDKFENAPHVEKLQISPHLSCLEIWNFSTWQIFSPQINWWYWWQIWGMSTTQISSCRETYTTTKSEAASAWTSIISLCTFMYESVKTRWRIAVSNLVSFIPFYICLSYFFSYTLGLNKDAPLYV